MLLRLSRFDTLRLQWRNEKGGDQQLFQGAVITEPGSCKQRSIRSAALHNSLIGTQPDFSPTNTRIWEDHQPDLLIFLLKTKLPVHFAVK